MNRYVVSVAVIAAIVYGLLSPYRGAILIGLVFFLAFAAYRYIIWKGEQDGYN